jgi:hypothetical protein
MGHLSWGSALIGAAVLASAPAFGEVLFECAIDAKQLRVTLDGDTATYSFGPKGAPELTVSADPRDLNYLPWDGMGVEMPEAVQFETAGTIYEVWYSVQKMLDESEPLPPVAGGVRVMSGEKIIADLPCTAPPSIYDLYRIYDAKMAGGQCYDWAGQAWGAACADQ